jgi:cystathionine beta-lyase
MYGCSLNASDLSLLERSMKTLAIRVEKQNYNALEIADYLHNHPSIRKVYFPGLITHPGHIIAKEQMHGFGGMMSFELNTEKQSDIARFLDSLNIIIPAGSLGGVESLITSPALTSHKLIGEDGRQSYGIKDNLLRLSVGIENIEDLINDLSFALKNV